MDLMECMEILFSLFGRFACFRLCLKHCSKDLHRFFFHKFYKSHEYLSLCDSFSLIDYTGVFCFFWGIEIVLGGVRLRFFCFFSEEILFVREYFVSLRAEMGWVLW